MTTTTDHQHGFISHAYSWRAWPMIACQLTQSRGM